MTLTIGHGLPPHPGAQDLATGLLGETSVVRHGNPSAMSTSVRKKRPSRLDDSRSGPHPPAGLTASMLSPTGPDPAGQPTSCHPARPGGCHGSPQRDPRQPRQPAPSGDRTRRLLAAGTPDPTSPRAPSEAWLADSAADIRAADPIAHGQRPSLKRQYVHPRARPTNAAILQTQQHSDELAKSAREKTRLTPAASFWRHLKSQFAHSPKCTIQWVVPVALA
jgi:hypothetical protein